MDRGGMFETAEQFGSAVRQHRQTLGLSQEALALSVGVGRRFIIDLEDGKTTCQLGKALAVARAVGIRLIDESDTPARAFSSEAHGYVGLPDLGRLP